MALAVEAECVVLPERDSKLSLDRTQVDYEPSYHRMIGVSVRYKALP